MSWQAIKIDVRGKHLAAEQLDLFYKRGIFNVIYVLIENSKLKIQINLWQPGKSTLQQRLLNVAADGDVATIDTGLRAARARLSDVVYDCLSVGDTLESHEAWVRSNLGESCLEIFTIAGEVVQSRRSGTTRLKAVNRPIRRGG